MRSQRWVVFGVGSIVYVWLLSRSWVGRDQIILLNLGEEFVRTGTLSPVAKSMSGGGMIPGSLLQVLIGLPLSIWHDYRAPLIPIAIFTMLGGLVLYKTMDTVIGPRFAFLYFALYWLSPWLLYHTAVLWEPAYLLLPSALHFWACAKSRQNPSFFPSVVLGAILLLTPQIHGSFLFLWILTALLVYKKIIRIHWIGALTGALIGMLTLIPMLQAALTTGMPSSLPTEGFIGKGFLYVWPVLKGMLYWVRLPSLDIGVALKEIVYFNSGWAEGSVLKIILLIILRIMQGISTLTIAYVLFAYYRLNKVRLESKKQFNEDNSTEAIATAQTAGFDWLKKYVWYSFWALAASAGFAPVVMQEWHVIIALHAAIIPFAIFVFTKPPRWKKGPNLIVAYILFGVLLTVIIGLGKPTFRKDALPKEVTEMPITRSLFPADMPIEPN
ncbi:MAG: hypothetical protein ACHQM6_08260 [Candidatus Kapaibacterium sp.]